MDKLDELLGKYSPKEPEEVLVIQRFVHEQFKAPAHVTVQENSLIITVQSAALANALRMRTLDLQSAVGTSKRLVFRIG